MTGYNRQKVIDSFSSIEAARRANKRTGGLRTRPSIESLPASDAQKKETEAAGEYEEARIEHTVRPDKYDITCYECGYAFVLTGALRKTICPKCRESLQVDSLTVEGECSTAVKTLGSIDVKKGAVLLGAELTGGEIILAGNAKEGYINASRKLTMLAGAKVNFANVKMKDLDVGRGVKVSVTSKLECGNLEVAGSLKGEIRAQGIVTIKAGGTVSGKIYADKLVMDEGGGLKAEVILSNTGGTQ